MAITWTNTPVLDSVQLPGSETKYWVKDTEARLKIEALANATHFLGVTSTELKDGSTTNPIDIVKGESQTESVTAESGDIVIYKENRGTIAEPKYVPLEFIFDGTNWQLLGDQSLETLGDLAYKDTASGEYTPQGTVNTTLGSYATGVYIGNEASGTSTAMIEVELDLASSPTSSFITSMSAALADPTDFEYYGIGLYANSRQYIADVQPTSSVCATQINSGTLPAITSSVLSANISGETLVFNLTDLGFNSGAFPTYSFKDVITSVDVAKRAAISSILSIPTEISLTPEYNSALIGIEGSAFTQLWYGLLTEETTVSGTFTGSSSTITVS